MKPYRKWFKVIILLALLLPVARTSAQAVDMRDEVTHIPNVDLGKTSGTWLTILISQVKQSTLEGPGFLRRDNSSSSTEWTFMDSGTSAHLFDIWGSSSDDVFAVGSDGTILRYNGVEWHTMNSGTTVDLQGIWGFSSSDVFAVGDDGTILHYSGNSWSKMNTGTTLQLDDVWGTNTADLFVVGGSEVTYSDGIILHYDGTTWQEMEDATSVQLDTVWGSGANDVFAVGSYMNPMALVSYIFHYDGIEWSLMRSGGGVEIPEWLNSVWGTHSNNVYVVGYVWDDVVGRAVDRILHYNGVDWKPVEFDHPQEKLNKVWGNGPSDIFTVGNSGTIIHYDGSVWRTMNSGTTGSLNSVWGSGFNDIFAVGYYGTILHYAGERYAVSGHIYDTAFSPLPDVTISAGANITTVTNAVGAYTLTDLLPGTYTLIVDKPFWGFNPPTRTVVLTSDSTNQNFIGIDVSDVISQVEYLGDDTSTRLNQLLSTSYDIARDGDYFAVAKDEDQVDLIADAIVGGAGVLSEGVDSVAKAQDIIKMNYPGVIGRGWKHIIDMRDTHEVARDAFREAVLHPVTAANAGRAAKEFFNGAHLYYAADMANTAADDLLYDLMVQSNWKWGLQSDLALQNELYPANEDLVNMYLQDVGATTLHTMDSVPFMLPDLQSVYIEDLTRRSQANVIMAYTLENRILPLHLARADREMEKDAWIEDFLAKYLLKQLAYLWGDGPAAVAIEVLQWSYDLYQNTQRIKEDMRMMHLAVEGMSGASMSENRIYLNTVHGMDNIVQGIEPQIARGDILSSTQISEGEYKLFGSLVWCEHTAYSELEISNPTSYPIVYQSLADYEHTGTLGLNYEPLVTEGVQSIPGGSSDTLRIYYKRDDHGVSPDEAQAYYITQEASSINITLLGSTDTGTYYITSTGKIWSPIRVETSDTTKVTLQEQQSAATVPYPVRTLISVREDDLIYHSYIWIDNPFTQTVSVTLTQALPANVEVISSSMIISFENTLSWHQVITPQTTSIITHTFRYQDDAGQSIEYPKPYITMTNLSATAQVTFTGKAASFTTLPPLSGVGIPPASVIKGSDVSVPITITNRITPETVSGTVQLEIIDFLQETHIYSDTYPVSITGRSDESISFTFGTTDMALGDYLLTASVKSNGGEEEIFTEYFTVQPIEVYLPLVSKNF